MNRPTNAEMQKYLKDYVEEYELRVDDGNYLPNAWEKTLMADCIYGLIDDDEFALLLNAGLPRGEEITSSENQPILLEAKVARTIFLVMKPANMIMADWDSGAILGKDNEFRKKIEMAAKLAVIDMSRF